MNVSPFTELNCMWVWVGTVCTCALLDAELTLDYHNMCANLHGMACNFHCCHASKVNKTSFAACFKCKFNSFNCLF